LFFFFQTPTRIQWEGTEKEEKKVFRI